MKRGVDKSKVQQVRRALSSPCWGPPVFVCADKQRRGPVSQGHAGILQAMMKLAAEQRERQEAQRQREKELAAVKVGAWGGVFVSGMAAAALWSIAACGCCPASAFTLSLRHRTELCALHCRAARSVTPAH